MTPEGGSELSPDVAAMPNWAEISVAFLLDEETLLLLGCADRPTPQSGNVEFADGGSGRFRSLSWSRHGHGNPRAVWSLLVLRFANIAQVRAARVVLIPDDIPVAIQLPDIPRLELDPAGLFERLKAENGEFIPSILDFLRSTLDQGGAGSSGRAARFLFAFLHALAHPDGFLEIFGSLDGGRLMMQGWSFHLFAGERRIIVETNRCSFHDASVAIFGRNDLSASARGVLLVLNDAGMVEPAQVRRAYFQTDTGLFYLDIYENRTLLSQPDAVAHLRSMLPSLDSDVNVRRRLKRICNARYEGRETVSGLSVPVRSALDLAVAVPGTGIFLSGWVLDPSGLVRRVTLRSTAGMAVRIDAIWHRMARSDVTQGYSHDPMFAPLLRPGNDLHGYVAFVPVAGGAPESNELYLEFALADDEFAFIPVRPSGPLSQALVRQILSSFNMNDPRVDLLITEHIGPAVTGILAALPVSGRNVTTNRLGRRKGKGRLAAVMPVFRADAGLDVNFARFASDPDFEKVELVIVMPVGVADGAGPMLRRYAEFYDLSIRVVVASGPLDQYEALETGANAAGTDVFLFISPNVVPMRKHWLSTLLRRLAQVPDAGMISPTLIYEDHSIKYAGIERRGDDGHFLTPNLAGYARHWLASGETRSVDAATMECCVLTRKAFDAVGGFSKDYVHPDPKGIDLSIKIRAAGFRCLWAPDVQLYAVDENRSEESEYWTQTGRLVDSWGFARKWAHAAGPAQPQ